MMEIWCDDTIEMSKEPPNISNEQREKEFAQLLDIFDEIGKNV